MFNSHTQAMEHFHKVQRATHFFSEVDGRGNSLLNVSDIYLYVDTKAKNLLS